MSDNNDYFKLVLLGNAGVGKTCIFFRLAENKYMENTTATIGADSKTKTIQLDGETIEVLILDTAGQERYRSMAPWYYRQADGIIIVYDCTNKKSFDSVNSWLKEIDEHANENVTKLLVGNKCDLQTQKVVDTTTAMEYANQLAIPFLETSTKNATNVEQAFMTMVSEMKNRRGSSSMSVEKVPNVIRIVENRNIKSPSTCCV
ncbi:ras-related protein Rab-1A-like isoform X1 [Ochlerotatus camptorhynchus]|uniref:ras-related protein Rab-1A-like isoform X1 n=2 Tax=Ochlerotatus camptorhynchus TaxID=644619 RepID=UPI0031D50402